MSPAFIVIVLLLLVVAGGLAFYFSTNQHTKDWQKNTVKVEKGSVDIRIIATGTVKPLSEIKISPKSTALVKELLVKQGDIVKKGDVLARMDSSNMLGQVEALRGTYLMAQDNYEKMLNGFRPQEVAISKFQERRANDIVHQAEQNTIRLKAQVESMTQQAVRDDTMAERQAYLETQGAVSAQDRLNAETQSKVTHAQLEAAVRELAQAEASVAQNRAEHSAAEKQAELTKIGNRREDIFSAKHAVMQAKGQLDALLSQFNDMTIRAPFDGVITQKYADAGAIVTPTTSAATTSATSSSVVALAGQLEIVAQVAETDIGKIKIGQTVEIISNAFPELVFHGKVSQIAPEAVVTQNVTTFEVHTSIDDDGVPVKEDSGRGHRHERRSGGGGPEDNFPAEQTTAKTSTDGAAPLSAAASTASTNSADRQSWQGRGGRRFADQGAEEQKSGQGASAWHKHEENRSDKTADKAFDKTMNDELAPGGEDSFAKDDEHSGRRQHRHRDSASGADFSRGSGKHDSHGQSKLLSGMNVSVRFVGGKMDNVLLVPTVCVLTKHGKSGVLVPDPDGTPHFKPVKTGASTGSKTAVLRGLKESDLVFLGLNKDQLEEQGYSSDAGPGQGGGKGGGRDGGGQRSAPIPRSFGGK